MDVTKTIDRVGELLKRIETLTKSDVLVGIPAEKASRPGSPINNAALGYIHNFGSPAQNIPARPFMTQGVKKIAPQLKPLFASAAHGALLGEDPLPAFRRIGMLARNAVVSEITDPAPPFVPLKPATIRARLRKTQAGRRKLRQIRAGANASGQSMPAALAQWGEGNITPLIDTGALRAAITYVVR